MSEIELERWRKFGHDRLYVNRGGQKLGYHNIWTGTDHELLEGAEDEYRRAVANWFARNPRVKRVVQQETVTPEVPQDDEDTEETIIVEQTDYRPSRREVIEAERAAQEALEAAETDEEDTEIPEGPTNEFDTVSRPEIDLALNKAGETARRRAEYEEPKSAIVSIFKQLTDAKTPARNWRLGAEGEELVAKQIAKLQRSDSRWQVVHDIRVGKRGANIDHVLVGPAGVFVIDSKHWRDADVAVHASGVVKDGYFVKGLLPAIRKQAGVAQHALSPVLGYPIEVQPVVAIVNARSFTVKVDPLDVLVTPRRQLVERLRRYPEMLDEHQIAQIFAAMRRPSTWL